MATYSTMIYDLGQSEYKLVVPVMILVQEYSTEVIASLPEFALYASAPSPALAIFGLKKELVSAYEELESRKGQLGEPALSNLNTMRKIIKKVEVGQVTVLSSPVYYTNTSQVQEITEQVAERLSRGQHPRFWVTE